MTDFRIKRRSLLAAAAAAPIVGAITTESAAAAVTFWASVVQEGGDYEARFPSLKSLADGRLMAVWYAAKEHDGTVGVMRMSFGTSDGKTWTTPHNALASAGVTAGVDTRDPKLGLMNDGSVILTFFTPAGKVYYSVWKPGWNYFTAPTEFVASGIGSKFAHGSVLALADSGTAVNQVLVPVYTPDETGTSGGAWYVRTRWDASTNTLVVLEAATRIIANNNPTGRNYSEPSFVQFGSTVVCAVRSQQDGDASPVIIVRWSAYQSTPSFVYQSFTGVLANSHHLLKTQDGRVLFTYGDKAQTNRPTVGMMIANPTGTWVKGKVLPIYDSGYNDQANPSSVEIAAGSYLTAGYNAKPKDVSPQGGTLWLLHSANSDY